MTHAIEIELPDLHAWDAFVADNREALEHAYGSVDRALVHACQGGLTLGGGASPFIHIYFTP
jgi:hypothetical protein